MQELFLMRVREAAINMWEAWDTGQDADDVWVLGGWVRRSSTTKSHRACNQNVPISVTTGAHRHTTSQARRRQTEPFSIDLSKSKTSPANNHY